MNLSKHSQQTIDRMKANSEAAKKRLAALNREYLLRQKARQLSRPKDNDNDKAKAGNESFGEAVARIARENHVNI
ncbi:MAG TPA: hypothetical protein VJ453_03475 [Terriglobales bacterium]|jgi:hypothetical protein|nr:hypothetical protein [Terriglobales bacterium]